MTNNDDLFDGMGQDEVLTVADVDTSVRDEVIANLPPKGTKKWCEYALSLLEESELVDGNPRTAGLRRLVGELLGREIVHSCVEQIDVSQDVMTGGITTVVYRVTLDNGISYSEVADVSMRNTDDMFLAYPVATAATRAEGRALRKLLQLGSIVAAEELTNKNTAQEVREANRQKSTETSTGSYEDKDSERMTDKQDNFINIRCEQIDVDRLKFMRHMLDLKHISGRVSQDGTVVINRKDASTCIDKLNELQQDKSLIPDSIKN